MDPIYKTSLVRLVSMNSIFEIENETKIETEERLEKPKRCCKNCFIKDCPDYNNCHGNDGEDCSK